MQSRHSGAPSARGPLLSTILLGLLGALPLLAEPPTSAPAASEPAADRPRLAVLDFSVGEDIKAAHGQVLAAVVREEFQKSGRYDLIDREMMRQRMMEKDLAATTECNQVQCLVKFGKSLDVQKIAGGFTSSFGKTWTLTLRLVDVDTGREELTFSRTCPGDMECLLGLARQGARVLLGLERDTAPADPPAGSGTPTHPKTLKLDLGGGVALDLLLIPAGEFMEGAPPEEVDRTADEGPLHKVRISRAFYLGKYEVTQAQWQAVIGTAPSAFKGDARLPVEQVSWDDGQDFCRKLAQRTGRAIRLPTEAEWEYACRAGTTTPFGLGGTISPAQVNYDGSNPYGSAPKGEKRAKPIPVGSFKPNAWGLYDMHGNVWEWCADWFDQYPGSTATNADFGRTFRVLRGGSWDSAAARCRSAERNGGRPAIRYNFAGFRVAADAE